MLVWTQPVCGIIENPAPDWHLFFQRFNRRVDVWGWAAIGLFPMLIPVVWTLSHPPYFRPIEWFSFLTFLLLTLFAKSLNIRLAKSNFDLEPVAFLASVMTIGPFWSFVTTLIAGIWGESFVVRRGNRWIHLLNIEMFLVAFGSSALLYGAAHQLLGSFGSLLVAGVTLPLFNLLIVSAGHAFVFKRALLDAWRENGLSIIFMIYLACIPAAYILALLYALSPFLILLFASPLVVLYRASKFFFDVKLQMGKALEAIGDILEERDNYTFGHTLRVAEFSHALAKEMGLKQDQVDLCVKVARLHDIGKIAVPDDVLKKEGALSKNEYHHIQKHVRMIPELFPLMDHFGKVLRIAMYHHERYDGKGYPFGLKGEEIPLEARIVAVADAWDAMTSHRVYRSSLPEEKALQILLDYSGLQWDPKVVYAFMRAYQNGAIQQSHDEAA